MTDLALDKLEIAGFKALVKPLTLDVKGYGPGLHYIGGKNDVRRRLGANGVGKSTLFDALCYCLYGITAGGLRGPDVKPWKVSRTPQISAHISVDDEPHIITRAGNRLSIDDSVVGQGQVDELVGLSYPLFKNTILQAQAQPLFFDLAPRDKLALFSDVLSLEKWETRSAQAKTKSAELVYQIDALERELRLNRANLEHFQEGFRELKQRSREWTQAQEQKYAEAQKDLKKARKGKEELLKKKAKYDLQHDGAATELRALSAELSQVSYEQGQRQGEVDRALMALRAAEQNECPTCGQKIKNAQRRQDEARQNVIAARSRRDELTTTRSRLEQTRADFQQKQDRAWAAMQPLTEGVARFDSIITESERIINENTVDPYREQLASTRRQIEQMKGIIESNEEYVAEWNRRKPLIDFWVKGFKDVRLFLIDEFLQELQLTTNAYLEEVGLEGWEVEYTVERQTLANTTTRGLNVFIKSPENTRPVKWESWSGGEGQRLRIIGACALSDTLLNHAGVTPSFEVYDEPTRHLSKEGVTDLCAFLSDRAKSLQRTIFYVDHMAPRSSLFTTETIVEKTREGTFLQIS